MNIAQILPLITPELNLNEHQNILYSLENFYSDNSHSLDLDWGLCSKHTEFKNIQLYRLHHWSVDDHEGGIEVFTYKDKPFGTWRSNHEDSQEYSILDYQLFKQVLLILLECIKPVEDKSDSYYEDKTSDILSEEYPLLQLFLASYAVQGKHLLYNEEGNNLQLIDSYRKSNDEGEDYFTKYFYITIKGVETRVHYKTLIGVINDNESIAKAISDGTLPIGNLLFDHNSIIDMRDDNK